MIRANSHLKAIASRNGGGVVGTTVAVLLAYGSHYACVWSGEMEDDGFNRLVLRARLSWRKVC